MLQPILNTRRCIGFCLWLTLAVGCSGPPVKTVTPSCPPNSAVARPDEAPAPAEKSDAEPFEMPESFAPDRYFLIGPFPKLETETDLRQSLHHDYLASIGGEANARIDASTRVQYGALTIESVAAESREDIVNFVAKWKQSPPSRGKPPVTNDKVAYAYAELDLKAAQDCLALFGSDDGAVVWVNGKEAHRVVATRALKMDEDAFEVTFSPGRNRILVKVDNGHGGWGFALRFFDAINAERVRNIAARRALDFSPHPAPERYLLDAELPQIVVGDKAAYRRIFGEAPLSVRWFGPDLSPVTSVDGVGRYTALLEAITRDGYRYQRMITFAKVPEPVIQQYVGPPYNELPELPIPRSWNMPRRLGVELGRQIWAGGIRSLMEGESSAITALALHELKQAGSTPKPEEPSWLHSGFVKNLAHQLRLRMKLENRDAAPLALPEKLADKAPKLRFGTEKEAGMKPGTAGKLRRLAQKWATFDKNGFVVLVARQGVVFMHEGFNGFEKETAFYPASIGKSLGGLLFARAVAQNLVAFDDKLASVFPGWDAAPTREITFRHCFNHAISLDGHFSRGGLFNPYLDQSLLIQDALFQEHGARYVYSGDDINLAGKALELLTGKPVIALLYEHLQRPFAEPVSQFDLGAGARFTAMYLAKIGQMILQDGAYGDHRFFSSGFLKTLWPQPIHRFAPQFEDKEMEAGIGFAWMVQPPGPREAGALGPNVIGHGAASGALWNVDLDHEIIIVVGRSGYTSWRVNEEWGARFVQAVAEGVR